MFGLFSSLSRKSKYSLGWLITAHILLLLSMALYAGNYVFFRLFNEHGHSPFLFSLLRTLFSIPVLPLIYILDSMTANDRAPPSTLGSDESFTSSSPPLAADSQDNVVPTAVGGRDTKTILYNAKGEREYDDGNVEKRLSLGTVGGVETDYVADGGIRRGSTGTYHNPVDCNFQWQSDREPLSSSSTEVTTTGGGGVNGRCAKFLRGMKLKRKAVIPVMVATTSGAVRQMIMPIALRFTTAENAGIIQPAVPVFTACLAMCVGLESGTLVTYLAITVSSVGLAIAGQVWTLGSHVDKGFLILLGVPISKGLQVIGLQYATKYHRSSVIQFYQIMGLVAFIVPVATFFELWLFAGWSFTRLWHSIMELDAVSWGAVFYSTIGIIIICWRIQIFGVRLIGSIGVALYQSFQPVFAFLFGWWILNEPIIPIQILGSAIVCAGLFIYQCGQCMDVETLETLEEEKKDAMVMVKKMSSSSGEETDEFYALRQRLLDEESVDMREESFKEKTDKEVQKMESMDC